MTQPTVNRPRARKIRVEIGPFATACSTFERGKNRPIELARITPMGLVYRLKGSAGSYAIPHETAFQKAVSLAVNLDTGPREGPIRRGS